MNLVFRDQDDDPTYTPHLWAYDHEKLVQLFTKAGFTTVEPWTFDHHGQPEAPLGQRLRRRNEVAHSRPRD